jgi:hypothetical protein
MQSSIRRRRQSGTENFEGGFDPVQLDNKYSVKMQVLATLLHQGCANLPFESPTAHLCHEEKNRRVICELRNQIVRCELPKKCAGYYPDRTEE